MEIALFILSIVFLYTFIIGFNWYKECKVLRAKNDELTEKLKEPKEIEPFQGLWQEIFKKEWNNYNTQDLLIRIKSLEKYLDLSFNSVTDGCIVNWFHEPNENNSDGYTKKFYFVNKDDVKITEAPFEKTSFKVKGVKKSDELKSVAASVAVKKTIEVLRNVLAQLEEE